MQLESGPDPRRPPDQLLRTSLDQALARLPEAESECFLLRELAGLSYTEIGTVMDLTPDAVRSRIYRARRALRATLSTDLGTRRPRPVVETKP